MNVLFLALTGFESFDDRNIYTDLLREFMKNGHKVCCISPVQKNVNEETHIVRSGDNIILRLQIGNTVKASNLLEKGIATLMVEPLFIAGIKKYFSNVKFDLVLYATPPVTLAKVIQFVKKRDGAKTYLMLKDIFPQNSVDLEILKKTGAKGIIYKFFRHKEKLLYNLSDGIGCMSQANCDYVLKHNPDISVDKVEVCPNSIEPMDMRISVNEMNEVRKKYSLPVDKKIFVYGGNLGRPQDVPFIVECLKECECIKDVFFVIAGNGTEKHYLEEYVRTKKPKHVRIFDFIPKEEYDKMIASCDIGLIFLDHRFTIPNFPSRLLSYMQVGLPVLACTDFNTDIGKIIVKNQFGWWCESDNVKKFGQMIDQIIKTQEIYDMKDKEYQFLYHNYNITLSYDIIMNRFNSL